MSDDTLKQLLRTDGYDLLREEPIYVNPDGPKAADEIERLRAELAAAKDDEHQKWIKALLKVLPEEKAVLFREICVTRDALKGDDRE